MEWVKTTAKTLPEAIDLALDNLGVDESEAEIVVIEEPRQGLFGRMRGTARVEARVKPKAIRPKTERGRGRKRSDGGRKNDRNRNRSKNRSGDGSDRGGNNRGGRDGGRKSGGSGKGQGGRKDGGTKEAKVADGGGANTGTEAAAGSSRGGSGGSGGQGNRKKSGGRNSSGRSKARNNTSDQDMKPKEESPVEDVAEHLEKFLTGLSEAFGFDSDVSVDSSEPDILVGQIEGQHGLLVGPKGRTLDAVQELARISCQRTVPSSVRIKVDVGGYRRQRTEALAAFAAKAAESAVEQGAEVALEPMSPADRKAVHDALSEDDRVETRSVGSEPRRKVLVIPVVEAADEESEDDRAEVPAEASSNGASNAEDHAEDTVDASEEE